VQDSNYGGVGLVVNGTTSTIGRFIPDHFEQTVVEHGVLTSICQLPTTFAYSGQKDEATNSIGAISYLTSPKIRLTAYNKQGQITENYWQDSEGSANDFMPLSANDVQAAVSGLDSNNNLPYDATINTGTLTVVTGGIIDYQFSLADHFTYQRSLSAQIAPFISGITFDNITAQDTDGVSLTNTQTVMPAGVEIRFGRMVLANSYGPETAALTQPLSIEYFDGNGFVKDTENNCSGYDAANLELSYISLSPSLTSVSGGTGMMTNGETRAITLSAPGSGNRGEIGVSYHSFDWFKYDWNNDGNLDDIPSAVATFGQYRGNDRIIYWRETSR
jgi:MSHA biogenesis protein MshQ